MEGNSPDRIFEPAIEFADTAVLSRVLTEQVLPLVNRPGRYIGGELGAVRGWDADAANVLLAFPDVYEIGMSHTGIRILYSELNRQPGTFADLVFTPWPDLEQQMRQLAMPLFSLNERRSADQFDIIGISLGYELAYTNLLTMIDLSGLPIRAAERRDGQPVIIAGGACTLNPAVVAPFIDVVFLGDGEPAMQQIPAVVREWKATGGDRSDLVNGLSELAGAWRPDRQSRVASLTVPDLNQCRQPDSLVPVIEPVHDRLALEVMRGCARGCRFCQAGMITRPVRERDVQSLVNQALQDIPATGYAEVSLLSLSSADYCGLSGVVGGIQDGLDGTRTNLVLPSLRVDSVSPELYSRINREKPANFTFAPEAGTQRLRDVINKQITEQDIVETAGQAFASGIKRLKLYFMIGLPTETTEDLDGLVALVGRVVGVAPRGSSQITVSISPFAPKPHTPFQWAGQISRSEMERRNNYLAKPLRRLGVKVSLRDAEVSFLEALLGLGDERISRVVEQAWLLGARFDGWSEHFSAELWRQAIDIAGVDAESYLASREIGDPLPWDTVAAAVDKEFLSADWQRALAGEAIADCRITGECYDCGACDGELDHVEAAAMDTVTSSDALEAAGFDPRNADPENPEVEAKKWITWRQQAAAKCWYRIEYAKTGDMRFLGHLDFQRQLQLLLRRSGVPVAYSKGFHPHPLLKFGPPLAVGIAGEREALDIALQCDWPGLRTDLNEHSRPGFSVTRCVLIGSAAPSSIDQHVERFDYMVLLPSPALGGPAEHEVRDAVDRFLVAENWPYVRHRPKGDLKIDVRKLVRPGDLNVAKDPNSNPAAGTCLQVSLRRGATGNGLPIHDFLAALFGDALREPRHCLIRRTGCYGRDKTGRWLTPLEEVGESGKRFWLQKRFNA